MSIPLADHPPHGTGETARLYEEVRKMTKDEALEVVLDAAESWANELTEYIIPAEEDWRQDEEAQSHADYADKIHKAIKILSGRDG